MATPEEATTTLVPLFDKVDALLDVSPRLTDSQLRDIWRLRKEAMVLYNEGNFAGAIRSIERCLDLIHEGTPSRT